MTYYFPQLLIAMKAALWIAAPGTFLGWWLLRHRRVRRGRRQFASQPMTKLVGAGRTGSRGVRIWGRVEQPGEYWLTLRRESGQEHAAVRFSVDDEESDQTFAVEYPDDFEQAAPLDAATRYEAVVKGAAAGELVGVCRFETAPANAKSAPVSFSIAAMSCHLPFDDYGFVSERARRLLSVLPETLEEHGVKRVLLMGDQMYGDLPEHCALTEPRYFASVAPKGRGKLTECSRQEVRRLYQMRYRIFWKLNDFQTLQARYACHPMIDDHEIIDNIGSSPEHQSPPYLALMAGASDAFYDYQAARVLPRRKGDRPSAFFHELEYGTVGVFAMDLRSERKATDDRIEICSAEQFEALSRFLEASADKHVVIVGLSVPLLHVPDWLSSAGVYWGSPDGDLADRWSNPKARESRRRLLSLIASHQRQHSKQRVILAGGDVHVGAVARLRWGSGVRDTYQLISSAVTNAAGVPLRRMLEKIPDPCSVIEEDGFQVEIEPLPAIQGEHDDARLKEGTNPYGGLNCGIIHVERVSEDESQVRLLLIGCTEEGAPASRVVYDSGLL